MFGVFFFLFPLPFFYNYMYTSMPVSALAGRKNGTFLAISFFPFLISSTNNDSCKLIHEGAIPAIFHHLSSNLFFLLNMWWSFTLFSPPTFPYQNQEINSTKRLNNLFVIYISYSNRILQVSHNALFPQSSVTTHMI